jgi:hypothetical protein
MPPIARVTTSLLAALAALVAGSFAGTATEPQSQPSTQPSTAQAVRCEAKTWVDGGNFWVEIAYFNESTRSCQVPHTPHSVRIDPVIPKILASVSTTVAAVTERRLEIQGSLRETLYPGDGTVYLCPHEGFIKDLNPGPAPSGKYKVRVEVGSKYYVAPPSSSCTVPMFLCGRPRDVATAWPRERTNGRLPEKRGDYRAFLQLLLDGKEHIRDRSVTVTSTPAALMATHLGSNRDTRHLQDT